MAGLLDVKELAYYISSIHKRDKQRDISPLKLQKSLYFLFAYWGAYVSKSKKSEDPLDCKKYLFDSAIEAWVYGPVIPEIYHLCKDEGKTLSQYKNDSLFKNKESVKEFIDGMLKDIFEVSDFKLVELSHLDETWKSTTQSCNMNKNKIIREYVSKI